MNVKSKILRCNKTLKNPQNGLSYECDVVVNKIEHCHLHKESESE